MGGGMSAARPGRFNSGKSRGTHWKRLGEGQGLDQLRRRENPLPPPGTEPPTIKPVESRYTDNAIPTAYRKGL
jgi:hypothetical protein